MASNLVSVCTGGNGMGCGGTTNLNNYFIASVLSKQLFFGITVCCVVCFVILLNRDGTIKGAAVSMHHVQNITILRYIVILIKFNNYCNDDQRMQ